MLHVFQKQKQVMKLHGSALQVVCAGVWHNAVLCALCWLCALLLPLLLMPVYTTGTGAVVRCSHCTLCL